MCLKGIQHGWATCVESACSTPPSASALLRSSATASKLAFTSLRQSMEDSCQEAALTGPRVYRREMHDHVCVAWRLT